jgi:DNA polymerase-3 subunit gamma/tau
MVLYNKYRPMTFDEVYGQEHIVQTLKNQVKNNSINHAYMFFGTRGSGKTTIARILSKAINCDNPVDGNPCCKCEKCLSIMNNSTSDFVELDAASNNSVENIRKLIDECRFNNTYLKYKIYIIDEVHMLSNSAFNALLKTLEEPPQNIIFILATTEQEKIPITISSRCSKFQFHLLDNKQITNMLKDIANKENRNIDDKSIEIIAKNAKGSMRDALSLLDQVLSYTKDDIDYDKTISVIGFPEDELMNELYTHILSKEIIKSLNCLHTCYSNGCTFKNIVYSLYDKFKDEFLKDNNQEYISILEELSKLLNKLNSTTQPLTECEIAIINICVNRNKDSKPINTDTIDHNIDLKQYYTLQYGLDRIPKIIIGGE